METATGKTRRLGVELPHRTYNEGYPVATTPDRRTVLIDTPAGEPHRIVAVPRSGDGNIQMRKDGKILISVSPTDSWFYRVAVLDPVTGRVAPVNVTYIGDTISANWAADGG